MGLISKIKEIIDQIKRIKYDNHNTRLLTGIMIAKSFETANSIKDAEFRVFSQFGDDGIIQFLVNKLSITNRTFVEFGVENYEEANTRFLLLKDNWKGLVIDGSISHISYIKNDPLYWNHDLTAVESFITTENINQLLENNGFTGRIGILSIDIDGNDYWVWQSITAIDADIVIVEYNSLFGKDRAITIPYSPNFVRAKAHYSNLYFGASLTALYELGNKKGYVFVGCNQAGNNAYFVNRDVLDSNLTVLTPEEGYIKAKFREARNNKGELTFANESKRKEEIIGLSVVNIITGMMEII